MWCRDRARMGDKQGMHVSFEPGSKSVIDACTVCSFSPGHIICSGKKRAFTTDQNPSLGFSHSVPILGSVSQVLYCVSTHIWSAFRISALSGVKMLYLRLALDSIICVITCLYSSIVRLHSLITGCQKGHEIFICEDWLHWKKSDPVRFSLFHWQVQMRMNKPWISDKISLFLWKVTKCKISTQNKQVPKHFPLLHRSLLHIIDWLLRPSLACSDGNNTPEH